MASRRTIKAQPRRKQAQEPEMAVAVVSLNGDSSTASPATKNGHAPSFEQIQRRAYELFMARGATHGCDLADWFNAEQELTAGSAAD
jgi:hypothetical protein